MPATTKSPPTDHELAVPAPVTLTRGERLRDTFALLSTADLGDLIDVDERTLAMWRSVKRGPDYVRLGRRIFYRRPDVMAWIELNVTPTDRVN